MEFSLSIILIYLNSKWPICCRNIMVSACEPIPKRCFLRWVGVKRNSRRKSIPAKQWTNQLHRENLWCLTLPVRKLWSVDGKVSAWGLFKGYKQSYSSKTDERHFFLALIQDLFQICPTCGRVCLSSIGLISHKKIIHYERQRTIALYFCLSRLTKYPHFLLLNLPRYRSWPSFSAPVTSPLPESSFPLWYFNFRNLSAVLD